MKIQSRQIPLRSSVASHFIYVSPAFQQRLSDMIHPGVDAMVFVFDALLHLFRVCAIGGGKRLVPFGEDEAIGCGRWVLEKM